MKPITNWQEQLAENIIHWTANKCSSIQYILTHCQELLTNNANCSYKGFKFRKKGSAQAHTNPSLVNDTF
jgi:hypothetical protein